MQNLLKQINLNEKDLALNVNWNEDQIIRYLYRKLAPCFKRDVSYFFLEFDERLKRHLRWNFFDGPNVTCRSICEFYHKLYNYLGIKSDIIISNRQKIPHYGLIVEGTKGWYYIDPLKDLVDNQLETETTAFARISDDKYMTVSQRYNFLTKLSIDEIKELDESLGLLEHGLYMNDFFEKMHSECTDNNHFAEIFGLNPHNTADIILAKMNFISEFLVHLGNIPGVIEKCFYYNYLKQIVFNQEEKPFIEVIIDRNEETFFTCMTTDLPNQMKKIIKFEESEIQDSPFSLNLRKIPKPKD